MPTPAPSAPAFKRRLAAIAFADVVGFAGRIESNDVAAMNEWKQARAVVIEPSILAHGGQLLRVVGDGLFVEFGSAIDAVRWAMDVQRTLAATEAAIGVKRLALRIGINVDDVLVDGGEVHGDGVNVAARIHQMAAPGDIVVTAAVREYAQNRIDARFEDLGEHRLKNISHPVRVARLVRRDPTDPPPPDLVAEAADMRSPLRLPTVAVLPLRVVGSAEIDDSLCAGVVEEVVGALSRTKSFFVVAREASVHDMPEQNAAMHVARELGARYLVLSSVRRSGALLRIAAKLVDAVAELTLWANHYDGALDDLFNVQEWVVSCIVAMVEPSIINAESARAQSRPVESLDAYDCVLRAIPLVQRINHQRWDEAAALLERAIDSDPFHARAHAYCAWLRLLVIAEAMSTDMSADVARAHELVDRAILLDPDDPFVLAIAAHVHTLLLGQPDRGLGLVHRAIELNDGCAFAWGVGALTHGYLSESEAALAHFERAHALTPSGPFNHFFFASASMAELVRGRFAEAARWAREALRWNPRFVSAHRHLVSSLANGDRLEEASAAARELVALRPNFRVSQFAAWYPLRPQESIELYLRGLRDAGLPE